MPSSSSSSSVKEEQPLEGTLVSASLVFKLPGQRYPTPSPGNGDRVFYETLIEQRPDSEMAQEWCVYYGVLDKTRAAALWELIQKRKAGKTGGSISPARATPVKSAKAAPPAKKAPAAKKPAAAKKEKKEPAAKKEKKPTVAKK